MAQLVGPHLHRQSMAARKSMAARSQQNDRAQQEQTARLLQRVLSSCCRGIDALPRRFLISDAIAVERSVAARYVGGRPFGAVDDSMSVQWQGDHRLLDQTREKQEFE